MSGAWLALRPGQWLHARRAAIHPHLSREPGRQLPGHHPARGRHTMTTVLIIPGLREHVREHWQTHLAERLSDCRSVVPPASDKFNLAVRLRAIDEAVASI